MSYPVLAYATIPSLQQAKYIAGELISLKLAACINILPAVHSLYEWEGQVQSDVEVVLMAKTTRDKFIKLQEKIVVLHPYDVPCVVSIPIDAGLPSYLKWAADYMSS